MGALLSTFGKTQTESRLLITSRYRFTLPDGRGGDLADRLTSIPLQPMAERDRLKQLRAAERLADQAEPDRTLAARALSRSGRQSRTASDAAAAILRGETEAATQALAAIEHYQRTGAPPAAIRQLMAEGAAQNVANAIVAFFKRMAFDTYCAALTESQAGMLRAAAYSAPGLPIPRPVLEQTGAAAGLRILVARWNASWDWAWPTTGASWRVFRMPPPIRSPARWPANWTTRPEPGWPPPRCRDSERHGDGRTALSPGIGGR